jgi:hypothetical protein
MIVPNTTIIDILADDKNYNGGRESVSLSDRSMYVYLLWKYSPQLGCFPTQQEIANELKVGIATVKRSIDALKNAGWILVEKHWKQNHYTPIVHLSGIKMIDQNDPSEPIKDQNDPRSSINVIPERDQNDPRQYKENNKENTKIEDNSKTNVLELRNPAGPQADSKPKQGKQGSAPYRFMEAFCEYAGIDRPAVQGKALAQAKIILAAGFDIPDIPDLYQACTWSTNGIDLGTVVSCLDKIKNKKARPPLVTNFTSNGNGTGTKYVDKNGRTTVAGMIEWVKELERSES